MIRITHFRSKCIGCNACVEANPGQWRISKKDGKSTLIGANEKKGIFHLVTEDFESGQNHTAAANCPVRIIRIEKFLPLSSKK